MFCLLIDGIHIINFKLVRLFDLQTHSQGEGKVGQARVVS